MCCLVLTVFVDSICSVSVPFKFQQRRAELDLRLGLAFVFSGFVCLFSFAAIKERDKTHQSWLVIFFSFLSFPAKRATNKGQPFCKCKFKCDVSKNLNWIFKYNSKRWRSCCCYYKRIWELGCYTHQGRKKNINKMKYLFHLGNVKAVDLLRYTFVKKRYATNQVLWWRIGNSDAFGMCYLSFEKLMVWAIFVAVGCVRRKKKKSSNDVSFCLFFPFFSFLIF